MGKSLTVFVCGTYGDLVKERKAVLEAIKKLQQQHDCMEYFGARSERPIEVCLEEVQRSDILVVIVAHRYGSLVPGKAISFSQAEYEEGFRLGKKFLIYLRDDNIPVLPRFVESDPDKRELLEKFKEILRTRHTPAIFSDANDLAVSVAADVGGAVQEPDEPDWSGLHNLPYAQNPMFTGREALLKKVHESLTESASAALSQPPAISGLGGIGKTQIAIEYAYRHMHEYKVVLWVNSDGAAEITSSYSEIAGLLDLPEKDEKELNVVIWAVRSWLEANKEWLLIFDNADEPEIIREYLPHSHEGRILITSRATAFGNLATAVEVDEMAENDAVDFLLKRAKIEKPNNYHLEATKEICGKFGWLPLAIDHAGSFLEQTKCSFADYLKSLVLKGIEVLKNPRYSSEGYVHTVATTWSMSIGKLGDESPSAIGIMSLCSFFAPDAIQLELIKAGSDSFDEPLKSAVSDTFMFNEVLGDLQRYSLIRRKAGEDEISIHRLLQAVIRHDLGQSEAQKWAELAVLCMTRFFPGDADSPSAPDSPSPPYGPDWWPCEKLLSHIRAFDKIIIDQFEVPGQDYALLLNRAAVYAYYRADYKQAEPLCKRALKIKEEALGTEHPSVAATLNNLAVLYRIQGRNADAEPLCRRALDIKVKAFGSEHPRVATSLNNLAMLYIAQGSNDKAEPLYKRALEIRERTLGPQHPDVAVSVSNLAAFYRDQGRFDRSSSLFQRALEIREQALDSGHLFASSKLQGFGTFSDFQGNKSAGTSKFSCALGRRLADLRPDDKDAFSTLEFLEARGVKTK